MTRKDKRIQRGYHPEYTFSDSEHESDSDSDSDNSRDNDIDTVKDNYTTHDTDDLRSQPLYSFCDTDTTRNHVNRWFAHLAHPWLTDESPRGHNEGDVFTMDYASFLPTREQKLSVIPPSTSPENEDHAFLRVLHDYRTQLGTKNVDFHE